MPIPPRPTSRTSRYSPSIASRGSSSLGRSSPGRSSGPFEGPAAAEWTNSTTSRQSASSSAISGLRRSNSSRDGRLPASSSARYAASAEATLGSSPELGDSTGMEADGSALRPRWSGLIGGSPASRGGWRRARTHIFLTLSSVRSIRWRDLGEAQAFDVPQHDHLAIPHRQRLDRFGQPCGLLALEGPLGRRGVRRDGSCARSLIESSASRTSRLSRRRLRRLVPK